MFDLAEIKRMNRGPVRPVKRQEAKNRISQSPITTRTCVKFLISEIIGPKVLS